MDTVIYVHDQTCCKCGQADIGSTFHRANHEDCSYQNIWDKHPTKEHIVRHCRNCHYEWVCAPVDQMNGTT